MHSTGQRAAVPFLSGVRALRSAAPFEPTAIATVKSLVKQGRAVAPDVPPDDAGFMLGRTRLAEAADFLDALEAADPTGWLLADCDHVIASLPAEPPVDWTDELTTRIRYALAGAQARYRRGQYSAAAGIVRQAVALLRTDNEIRTAVDARRRGLLAWAYYQLGHLNRNIGKFEDSRRNFEAGLRHHVAWLDAVTKRSPKDSDRSTVDIPRIAFVLETLMLIGLASVEIRAGSLTLALSLTQMARLCAARGDRLLQGIVMLTYGSALRSLAGDERQHKKMLSKASDMLKDALGIFNVYKHRRYVTRASLELAIASLYAGDLAGVERYAKAVDVEAQKSHAVRWSCQATLVRSRALRKLGGNMPAAAAAADRAVHLARIAGLEYLEVESLLQRGYARLCQLKTADAQADLDEAYKRATGPRQSAVAALLLARCGAQASNRDDAMKWLEIGRALTVTIEFPVIRQLARNVEAELSQDHGRLVIEIDPSRDGWAYETYEARLRDGLVALAMKDANNVQTKAADRLDVTRVTFASWLRQRQGRLTESQTEGDSKNRK